MISTYNRLPRIQSILHIEPFAVTCLWTNGEIRINDFSQEVLSWQNGLPEQMRPLADYEQFKQAQVLEHKTLGWPNVLIILDFPGLTEPQPLDFDPDELYRTSQLVTLPQNKMAVAA